MLKTRIMIFAMAAGLAASLAIADTNKTEKLRDAMEIRLDKKEIASTRRTLHNLTHNIDLWHDANLKADRAQVFKYENQLSQLLQADIRATSDFILRYQREVRQSAEELHRKHRNWSERADDRHDLYDDRRDLKDIRSLLKVKQRLASSFAKSVAFSNKYRLLGDYQEILRQELGMVSIELAEDIGEFKEDR